MYDFHDGFVTGQPELPPSEERREHMCQMKPAYDRINDKDFFKSISHMPEAIAASLYRKLKKFLRVTPDNALKWQPREDSQSKPSFEEFIKYYNIRII
jgi:Mlc titration factor MtfA (ptsG expression regulator)